VERKGEIKMDKCMLDKNRDYGIVGAGDLRFYAQDNKLFDQTTLEEVEPKSLPEDKPKPPPALTCKFCGAKRDTPDLFKEHILAMHRGKLQVDDAKPQQQEKAEEKEPEEQPEQPLTWRQQAKRLGISTFQRTKADVIAEIEEKTKKE
jgi:hypothetical protein